MINDIIVGKPQDKEFYEEYKEIYKKVIENKDLPILYNINFGHSYPRCIIPYGIKTEIDLDKKTIRLKKSFFRVINIQYLVLIVFRVIYHKEQ